MLRFFFSNHHTHGPPASGLMYEPVAAAAPTASVRLPDPDDALVTPGATLADGETFARVFRRYHAPLVRYAHGLVGSQAADAVQDVFLKLWRERAQIEVDTSLQALLYTMVRNRALNLIRRDRRLAPDVAPSDVLAAAVVPPPVEGEARELADHLSRWIADLPGRRREAFVLSRYHDLSHAEIARVMQLSVRTVDTHIVHALRELRRRLDELQHQGTAP